MFSLSNRAKAYKNLLGVCLSIVFVYGSFIGLGSLQSSINEDDGLGLTSVSVVYGTKMVALVFTPTVNAAIGSKYSVVLSYIFFVPFMLANYYPKWYTLIPVSVLMGVGHSFLFVNGLVHTSLVADMYAKYLNEKPADAIILFAGAFGMALKVSQVLGSIVSSAVLFDFDSKWYLNQSFAEPEDYVSNDTCSNTEAAYVEQDTLYFVLVTLYVLSAIIGIGVSVMLVEHLATDLKFISFRNFFQHYVSKPLSKLFKLLISLKMALLFPLFVVNGISLGFILGTFPKACSQS